MHIIKWFRQVLSNYPVFKMSWKLQGCKFIFFWLIVPIFRTTNMAGHFSREKGEGDMGQNVGTK